jgi:Lon protease-like protein
MRPETIADLPAVIPVFPLAGALLLPFGKLPLNIFEPRYLAMTNDALAGDRIIGMIQPTDAEADESHPSLYAIGCAGRITSFTETDDNRFLITLSGLCRFSVTGELPLHDGYRRAEVDWSGFEGDMHHADATVPRERLVPTLREYCQSRNIAADWKAIEDAPGHQLVTTLSMLCPFEPNEKQALLESPSLETRAELMISLMAMAVLDRDSAEQSLN